MKIRFGTSRVVFIFDKWVIKCPCILSNWHDFLCGFIQNLTERYWYTADSSRPMPYEFWKKANKDLAFIRYADPCGFIVIMERVTIIEDLEDREKYAAPIKEMLARLATVGVYDVNEHNCGLDSKGNLVCCDYGYFTRSTYLGNPRVFKDEDNEILTWSYRYFFRPVRNCKRAIRDYISSKFK